MIRRFCDKEEAALCEGAKISFCDRKWRRRIMRKRRKRMRRKRMRSRMEKMRKRGMAKSSIRRWRLCYVIWICEIT